MVGIKSAVATTSFSWEWKKKQQISDSLQNKRNSLRWWHTNRFSYDYDFWFWYDVCNLFTLFCFVRLSAQSISHSDCFNKSCLNSRHQCEKKIVNLVLNTFDYCRMQSDKVNAVCGIRCTQSERAKSCELCVPVEKVFVTRSLNHFTSFKISNVIMLCRRVCLT